jgi:hypothetical protein
MVLMKRLNDFEECVEFGTKWEKAILDLFNNSKIVLDDLIEYKPYDNFPEKQKSGIDAENKAVEYQVKTRSGQYSNKYMRDVLFEIRKGNKDGCHIQLLNKAKSSNFHKLPVLIYCWIDINGQLREKGIWIAYNKKFCDYIEGEGCIFLEDIGNAHSIDGSSHWETKNKIFRLKNDTNKFFRTFSTRIFHLRYSNGEIKKVKVTLDDWI